MHTSVILALSPRASSWPSPKPCLWPPYLQGPPEALIPRSYLPTWRTKFTAPTRAPFLPPLLSSPLQLPPSHTLESFLRSCTSDSGSSLLHEHAYLESCQEQAIVRVRVRSSYVLFNWLSGWFSGARWTARQICLLCRYEDWNSDP